LLNIKIQHKIIMPYIYLIHTRASLNINEPVYKIGKTNDFSKRISDYGFPKVEKIILNYHILFLRILKKIINRLVYFTILFNF
jgi:hypothetical protein